MQQPLLDRKTKKFFGKIEKIIQSKIPQHIKLFLHLAGFESEFALLNIDKKSIKLIESHLENNRDFIVKTKYENISPFKFNVSDRTSVLNLPKLISNAKREISETELERKKLNVRSNFNKKKLIEELLAKANTLLNSKKIKHKINENDIVSCRIVDEIIELQVQCSQCMSTVRCKKSNRWFYSNLISHIVKHENKEKTKNSATNLVVHSVRKVNSNQSVLNSLLSGPKQLSSTLGSTKT